MAATVDRVEYCDVIVVGGGAAGMSVALAGGSRRVRMLLLGPPGGEGASAMAQGGIAAAIGPGDCARLHAEDTLAAGAWIGDRSAVEILTAAAADEISLLARLGARFDLDTKGWPALGREAAHGHRRIVHARGDATGAEISSALGREVRSRPNVDLETGTVAHELIRRGGRVVGVLGRESGGAWVGFLAPAVVLCTGGIGRVYRETTNPPSASGDGLAMAARAGARLLDLEFVQFHPTALAVEEDPRPLLTEALRGAGAVLLDGNGTRFMTTMDPRAELAPRDVVTRAIAQVKAGGYSVWLDARSAIGSEWPERFPTVFEICLRHGLDPRHDLLPVSPAAHYHMGGVATDSRGRTSLPGLWAAGEVACTGAHGANRLASNSLLECLVFGARAGEDARLATGVPLVSSSDLEAPMVGVERPDLEARIRSVMSEWTAVTRSAEGLQTVLGELEGLRTEAEHSGRITRNLWTVARLVTRAAAERPESVGSHFRTDASSTGGHSPYRLALRCEPGFDTVQIYRVDLEGVRRRVER